MNKVSTLHYLTQDLNSCTHAELAELACAAGVRWIQLRAKGVSLSDWVRMARDVRSVCERYRATFLINDNPFVAKEAGADGVHLGQKDMDPVEARSILGTEAIIGGTANTVDQALILARKGVNYIGLGPLRHTATKSDLSPVLGFDGVASVIKGLTLAEVNIPVVVIGGIREGDTKRLRAIGAHGVAVSSVLTRATDKATVVRELQAA